MTLRKKIILNTVAVFAVLFVVCAGVLTYFGFLLFDNKPFKSELRTPDWQVIESIQRKFLKSFGYEKGSATGIASLLFGGAATFELNFKEINAVADAIVAGQQVKLFAAGENGGKTLISGLYFKDGTFTVLTSTKLNFSTPFGSYLNIKTVFKPGIKGKHFSVDVREFKIGNLSIPLSCVNKQVAEKIADFEQKEWPQKILSAVEELTVENERLIVRYNARNVLLLVGTEGLTKFMK